jgi:hypothetical protein
MSGNTVNIIKFDEAFQDHLAFKQIIAEINHAPRLVDQINRFSGEIELGEPGKGTYFSPAGNKIYIDESDVDKISTLLVLSKLSDNPEKRKEHLGYLGRFTAGMAHELGHAVEPGGLGATHAQMTLEQYVDANLRAEGVAILEEFRIIRELNSRTGHPRAPLWSSGVQEKLEVAWAQHGNTDNAQFAEKAIKIGADYYRSAKPSTTPNLNYEQYYSVWHTLQYGQHSYTSNQITRIDWEKVTTAHFAINEVNGQKKVHFVQPLPLKPTQAPATPAPAAPSKVTPASNAAGFNVDMMRQAFAPQVSGAAPSPQANQPLPEMGRYAMPTVAEFRKSRVQNAEQAFSEKLDAFMEANPEARRQLESHVQSTGETLDAAAQRVLFSEGSADTKLLFKTPKEGIPLIQSYQQLKEQRQMNEPVLETDRSITP